MRASDVRAQLAWAANNGFGGVEIAWVYPQPGAPPGPAWLSREWSAAVAEARCQADALGLGCDFTFGTLWPFGGSFVSERDAARTYDGPSAQRLGRSWELPHAPPGRILNHLDRGALRRYARRVGDALGPALAVGGTGLFCDSWEVESRGLWTAGFDEAFRARFGYDVAPFMPEIDAHEHARYDYRSLIADLVIDEFYRPFTAICHDLGAVSRVQCHGAPADLVAAYASVDVPETEAVLFDPPFAAFAASAAALRGKPIVSAEAFTCLYGWEPHPGPGPEQGREQVADLKLVADALFANGVNMIVWHGMPSRGAEGGGHFYASVHVGPDAAFADEIPAFNAYLERVSSVMREGSPVADVAVYVPLEDNRMRGELPPELRRPSAGHYWELQSERMPPEVKGYRPIWITTPFLEEAIVRDGLLVCGDASVRALVVDVEWLAGDALSALLRLASSGLTVSVRRPPSQPGRRHGEAYARDVERLYRLPTVSSRLDGTTLGAPFLEGADMPEHVCRETEDEIVIFFGHPSTRTVKYPLDYGQSALAGATTWRGRIRRSADSPAMELELRFPPRESLLVRIDKRARAAVRVERLGYRPPPPDDSDLA